MHILQLWENRIVKIPKTYFDSRVDLALELEFVIADSKLLLWEVSCIYCMRLSSNTATLFRFDLGETCQIIGDLLHAISTEK